MYPLLFNDFLTSGDSLRVYRERELVFSSNKDRLLPLMEYLDHADKDEAVVVFDKIVGNAAALLAIRAGCRELFSPFASQLAVGTLEKYRVKYHLGEVVAYIQQADGDEMCPMEKLSLGKEPEEFYLLMREIISKPRQNGS